MLPGPDASGPDLARQYARCQHDRCQQCQQQYKQRYVGNVQYFGIVHRHRFDERRWGSRRFDFKGSDHFGNRDRDIEGHRQQPFLIRYESGLTVEGRQLMMVGRGSRPAYTLLEILVASAVGVLLMGALYTAISVQLHHAQIGREIVEQSVLARSLLTRIDRDIRASLGP